MISQTLGRLATLAIASWVHVSLAQQTQLQVTAAQDYPEPLGATVNLTGVFSVYSDGLTSGTWSRDSWNGLTTFAHTNAVRCFGSDASVAYDVAILGECRSVLSVRAILMRSRLSRCAIRYCNKLPTGVRYFATSWTNIRETDHPSIRARFGPNGIRQGSRRVGVQSINVPMKTRISDHLDVVDCGDVRKS